MEDKIVIMEGEVHRTEKRYDNDIEYVRLDALLERAEKWFIEHTNIPQEVETNEDGEPLADSYIKYAKARLEAAKEMFEDFKQAMSELK